MSWMNTNISKVTLQKQYLSHTNLKSIYIIYIIVIIMSVNLTFSSFCSLHKQMCVCEWEFYLGIPIAENSWLAYILCEFC